MSPYRQFVLVEVLDPVEAKHVDVVTKVRDNGTKMLSGLDLRGDKHRFTLEFPSMDSKTSNLS